MLELQNICYQVSTPEGTQDILKQDRKSVV